MQVVATREGFYGTPPRVRKPGDVFDLASKKHFSQRWMLKTSTDEGQAYLAAFNGDPEAKKNVNRRDDLTGERLAAGGIAEQLSVALEEKRQLMQENAELKAEIDVLKERQVKPKSKDPNPAETPDEDKAETSKPSRVRRRGKPASK